MNHNQLIEVCQQNPFIETANPDYDINDYSFNFIEVDDIEGLCHILDRGNVAIRTGIIYKNKMAFIQQVNGGDEYLAIKEQNGQLIKFETVSLELIYERRGQSGVLNFIEKHSQ